MNPNKEQIEEVAREYHAAREAELSKIFKGYQAIDWEDLPGNERAIFQCCAKSHLTTQTTQVESLQSQVDWLKSLLVKSRAALNHEPFTVAGMLCIREIDEILSTLPATPNLVERVRELEAEVSRLKERLEAAYKTAALGDDEDDR